MLAGLVCRCYSTPLQRVITDFGADHPFGGINQKLKEHYGIEVPVDSSRKITELHAQAIATIEYKASRKWRGNVKPKETIIGEIDGSMVPIVEFKEAANEEDHWDKRQHKSHHYCEARLSLAHEKGSVSPVFAGTLSGVEEAGAQLMDCVKRVGFDKKTKVHCVGDGAVWIADQVKKQLGKNGRYLVDFYHLCEYISAASIDCAEGQEKEWIEHQKSLFKKNRLEAVLLNLEPFLEPSTMADAEAPVRSCYRYIKNRPNQFDYKSAIEEGLPIGSGEIESAHRYVIQKRLKIAGSWWRKETAGNMLALRVLRANKGWDSYWLKQAA